MSLPVAGVSAFALAFIAKGPSRRRAFTFLAVIPAGIFASAFAFLAVKFAEILASAFAFLAVIPAGNLLLALVPRATRSRRAEPAREVLLLSRNCR